MICLLYERYEEFMKYWVGIIIITNTFLVSLVYPKELSTLNHPPVALRPKAGHDLLILEVYKSQTTTHHSR
jgi:hypothetical protein